MNPEISVLFEDEVLLAVNKPAGLPVHVTLDPLRPHLQGLLEKKAGRPLVLFHRLDLETTGVVLFGKKASVNKPMYDTFAERRVKKTYWCVVDGRWLPEWNKIETFIDKAGGGKWRNVKSGGLTSMSTFRLLATNGEKSWLEVQPKTGRTHQIRLHCLSKQHPILGDGRYGKPHRNGVPMALHARSLLFKHPVSGDDLFVEAPVPDYWDEVWLRGLKK